ncbi:MAG: hypothetical protein K8I00_09355 [Candidatus Omnitrophica bacterium]|nr:hypothetical protein [Candidatus Omnitrophota bacterium]
MKYILLLALYLITIPASAFAESPKYELATFGSFLVITVDKSFSPRLSMAIRKGTILAVHRKDKHIEITTSLLKTTFDQNIEDYIETNQTYDLYAKDDEEGAKLFFRIMEQISD